MFSLNSLLHLLLIASLPAILVLAQNEANSESNNDDDQMECPNTFWTEIESGCESDQTSLNGRLKVFQGIETEASRWPYLVSLQRRLTGPFRGCYLHRCGATLIAPNMVLTAAHCLWSPNHDYRHPSIPNVLGVELYAALGPKCRHQVGQGRVRLVRYFISNDYVADSETRGGGDIAILQLDRPLEGGMFVNIAQAPEVALEDKQLAVVGWGDTEADDVSYAIRSLRMGVLKHVSNSICEAIMSAVSDGRLSVQSDKEICAYNSEVDSCDGDSGGPLLMADEFGGANGDPSKDIQVGIVSWGPPGACGQSSRQLVGVYTSITYYLPWIEQIKGEIVGLPPIDPIPPSTAESAPVSAPSQPKCTTTKNGCQCPQEWTFNSPTVHKGCTNPDGDAGGPWCIIVPDSCPEGMKPAGDLTLNNQQTGSQYDYCEADCVEEGAEETSRDEACAITIAGCQCKESWEVVANGGEVFTGCANPDNDPRGSWCHYENPSCIDEPAGRGWDYCKPGCDLAQLKSNKAIGYSKELNDEWQPKQLCSCNDQPDKLPQISDLLINQEWPTDQNSQNPLAIDIPPLSMKDSVFRSQEPLSEDNVIPRTCQDVDKLGKCGQYTGACPCTCGMCSSQEVQKELQKG